MSTSPWDTKGPSTITPQLKRGHNTKPAKTAFGDGGTMAWLQPKRFHQYTRAGMPVESGNGSEPGNTRGSESKPTGRRRKA